MVASRLVASVVAIGLLGALDHGGGDADTRAMKDSTSSPVIGRTSICVSCGVLEEGGSFSVAAMSRPQRVHALRPDAGRSTQTGRPSAWMPKISPNTCRSSSVLT